MSRGDSLLQQNQTELTHVLTLQEKAKTLLALGHRQLKQLNATGSLVGSEGAKWRGLRK